MPNSLTSPDDIQRLAVPFTVSKLTDVVPLPVLQTFQSGFSVQQGVPLAIVEPDPPAAWAAFSAEDAALVARAAGAVARVGTLLSEMGESSHLPPPGVPLPVDRSVSSNPADPPGEALVWQLCADLPCSAYDRQRLLAARDQRRRLQLVAELGTELGDDLVRMMGGEPR